MGITARMECTTVRAAAGQRFVAADPDDEGALEVTSRAGEVIGHVKPTRGDVALEQVTLRPVDDDPVNLEWSKGRPDGRLALTLDLGSALGAFKVGKRYTLEITEHVPQRGRRS